MEARWRCKLKKLFEEEIESLKEREWYRKQKYHGRGECAKRKWIISMGHGVKRGVGMIKESKNVAADNDESALTCILCYSELLCSQNSSITIIFISLFVMIITTLRLIL